jgi:hypothetical protein
VLDFNEERENCPWHHEGECRATEDLHIGTLELCNKLSCAVWYWIKKMRGE